ncbi:MAG TPA: hypothetical protein VGC42_01845, partial [Kofleriaceae bacterium]
PRIGVNSLLPGALASSLVTTAQLDPSTAAAMATSADARDVLAYAISCALDPSQSFTYAVDGVDETTTGAMAVAPAWTSRALTAGEAAWVSACVLSRLNLTGATVSISARGDSPGYATTAAELAGYQIEEGAFWGNVFVDEGAVAGSACDGVDQAADDSYGDLPLRQCAQPATGSATQTPCGLRYAGLCRDACATATSPYAGCAVSGDAADAFVVTSFLSGEPR